MDLIVDFPQRQVQSLRRVTFAEASQLRIIENLTYENRAALWFTNHELKSFKRDLAQLILRIRCSGMTIAEYSIINASDTSAFMGLEGYYTDKTPQKIKNQRRSIQGAVLVEQLRQVKNDTYDPDAMARVSQEISAWSRRRARVVALIHVDKSEADAMEYFDLFCAAME